MYLVEYLEQAGMIGLHTRVLDRQKEQLKQRLEEERELFEKEKAEAVKKLPVSNINTIQYRKSYAWRETFFVLSSPI